MYCSNCASKLTGSEKYCPNCGNKINDNIKKQEYHSTEGIRTASIILGIIAAGGLSMLLFAPISLILSIIGLILAIKSSHNSKNLAGIIINSISLFISLIITLFITFVAIFLVKNIAKLPDYLNSISSYGEPVITDNYGDY